MMQNELEERLGYRLEPWQWEMAHYVYQNSPTINKDYIAELVKNDGFRAVWNNQGRVRQLYKELQGPPIIIEHRHNLWEEYDVTHEYMCINTTGNLTRDIYNEIKATMLKEHKDLMDQGDYFDQCSDKEFFRWDPGKVHWLVVHYVKGGSEGYYVHFSIVDRENKYSTFILAKTLCEGEEGIKWAEQMVAALSRIVGV